MNQKQTNKSNERNNSIQFMRSILTGFIGGLFWSAIGIVLYYFSFTKVSLKSYILNPWFKFEWVNGWIGDVVSMLIVGLISIVIAIVYYFLFKKYNSMWIGVIYGVGLCFIVLYFINPMYVNIPTFAELDKNTIITTFSLFCLYGVFVGYSISFDYNDNRMAVRDNSNY